jgi:SAM-dependent methyltransferase
MYNDPSFDYAQFWTGREYEHHAEIGALRKLLGDRKYSHAADVGGGYGRLSIIMTDYADQVTLTDPSSQQLALSQRIFPGQPFERRLADAARLPFPDASIDLAVMVRVLHHLPEPGPELAELSRILRPGGHAVIEVANSAHAARRAAALLRGRRIPSTPVDLRSEDSKQRDSGPYVNHHPRTIIGQLAAGGLHVRRTLSVSNLRHPVVKTIIPRRVLLAVERAAQRPLSRIHFGPSIFLLVEKETPATRPRLQEDGPRRR